MTENEAAIPEPSKPEPSKAAERPRPQYGEMAPEGWEWNPPAPPEATAPAAPAPSPPAPAAAPWHPAPTGAPATGPGAPPAPTTPAEGLRRDRRITIALLIVSVFGLWMAISTLSAIPEALQMLHSQQGLAEYVASEADMRTILIGTVLQGVLWVATAVWAVLRMQHARRAFWVPLVGAALSLLALFVTVSTVAANDPLLMQLSGAV